jgi:2-(1,2-epoxy-1,2-dihydrophenyl)acetyl-CoA isomerase
VSERPSSEQSVLLDIRDGVAHLTLNRPDAANAIDLALARALGTAVSEIADSPEVRAVLLTGAGARFCGGGDVQAFGESGDALGAALGAILGALHPAIEGLGALQVPVVAAVQGSAAGAGLALVAGADLVIAAASAKLVMAYTAIGLVPDGGSTWYLPRVVGLHRALELSLTNRALSADEACAWGLVTRVVPDEDLVTESQQLVARLAAGPTHAFGATKQLLRASLGNDLPTQLDAEGVAMVRAGDSPAGREGVAAFVAKRTPTFPAP